MEIAHICRCSSRFSPGRYYSGYTSARDTPASSLVDRKIFSVAELALQGLRVSDELDDVRDRHHAEEQATPPDRRPADQYPNWLDHDHLGKRHLALYCSRLSGTWMEEKQEGAGAGVEDPVNPCPQKKKVQHHTRLLPQHPPLLPAIPSSNSHLSPCYIDCRSPFYEGSRLLHYAKAEQLPTNQHAAGCSSRQPWWNHVMSVLGPEGLRTTLLAVFKAFLPTLLKPRKTLESEFSSTSPKGHETYFWDVVVIGGCPGAIYTPSLGSQSTRWLSDQVTSRSTLVNRGSTLIIVSFCMISTMVSIMSAVCASAAGIGLRREHQCGRWFVARTQIIAILVEWLHRDQEGCPY
ncbi:hypothetical protein BKA70DRAFT_1536357 [Coprinopsis sp. MPI-PUGE-AT-0042]|nr:hypothetical protein BKA70DRAFT_1536357 [Coprinopsis sp. MPI-PUGE-AT-0042]